eukprot:TRINITY_DN9333_c0_g1_i1.p2 TRINITY_DN9333_c0_g1~~TRINITY_DN9333_c0_g1_i1.p2  ORF type:complete len:818 (+),score=275.42 TRINITY_DN9333_c0_g1_i1:77-2530(+)
MGQCCGSAESSRPAPESSRPAPEPGRTGEIEWDAKGGLKCPSEINVAYGGGAGLTNTDLKVLADVLTGRPKFEFYKVYNKTKEIFPMFEEDHPARLDTDGDARNITRRPQDLHRCSRLPYTMRPAVTLLRLLGRDGSHKYPDPNWDELIASAGSMPKELSPEQRALALLRYNGIQETVVALKTPLDKAGPVTVTAHEIDKTLTGELTDQWYEKVCELEGMHEENRYERHSGGSPVELVPRQQARCAKYVYGPGEFTLSSQDCHSIAASTRLATSGEVPGEVGIPPEDTFPRAFVSELWKRFFFNKDYAWFFNGRRATPLVDLTREDTVGKLADEDLAKFSDLVQEADKGIKKDLGNIEETRKKRGSYLEWGTKYTDKDGQEQKASGAMQKLTLQICRCRHLCQRMYCSAAREEHVKCVAPFREFYSLVKRNPEWLGFRDEAHVDKIFSKAAVQLTTEACMSQIGYFLLGPAGPGTGNQLIPKTKNPVVFLSAAALDFGTPPTTKLEAPLFFEGSTAGGKKVWKRFKPGGEECLRIRLKSLFGTIFTAAKAQGVTDLSMLPIGLGVFVSSLKSTDDQGKPDLTLHDEVVRMYFTVQFSLLRHTSWGFRTYYLSCPPPLIPIAKAAISETVPVGTGPVTHQKLCDVLAVNVVVHSCDAKAVAIALAGRAQTVPAFLNPSDCRSILMGAMGMFWELGRGIDYVGEEDFGATSTGCLADMHISGRHAGARDINLHCRDKQQRAVHLRLRPTVENSALEWVRGSLPPVMVKHSLTEAKGKGRLELSVRQERHEFEVLGTAELCADHRKQLQEACEERYPGGI